MSLNLTIVNEWGVWQCSDHRLTVGNQVVDDHSEKHFALHCKNGSALLAYAGIGSVHGISLSTWLLEMLRGHSRTVEENLYLVRVAASVHLAPFRIPHMFTFGAYVEGETWVGQILNFTKWQAWTEPTLPEFRCVSRRLWVGGKFLMFGDTSAVCQRDIERLESISQKRPRKPEQFATLLAETNRRAALARTQSLISPHCTTTHMPPAGAPISSAFHAFGELPPRIPITPSLLWGIDETESMRAMMNISPSGENDSVLSEALDRALSTAVTPRNRLSRQYNGRRAGATRSSMR